MVGELQKHAGYVRGLACLQGIAASCMSSAIYTSPRPDMHIACKCSNTSTTCCLWLQHRGRAPIVAAEASDHASHHPHNKPKRRVVVTGMGVVTSLGHDPQQFYDNLLEVSSSQQCSCKPSSQPSLQCVYTMTCSSRLYSHTILFLLWWTRCWCCMHFCTVTYITSCLLHCLQLLTEAFDCCTMFMGM